MGYKKSFAEGTIQRMEELMRKTQKVSEFKRIQCVYFRAKFGFDSKQISQMVGLKDSTVRNIHYSYMKEGEASLRLRGKGGRHNFHLTISEEAALIEGFSGKAEKGGILEVSQIHRAHRQRIGKDVALSTTYRMLHRHGWRKIAPRPQHPKADPVAVADFKKTLPH
jgi:transposase